MAFTCLSDPSRAPRLVPGGGAIEAELHLAIQEYILSPECREGLEARTVEAFAGALLSLVYTLCENAGLRAAVAEAELLALHKRGLKHQGVSVEGKLADMCVLGVVEPIQTKVMLLRHATEVAVALTKITGQVVYVGQKANPV